MPAAVALAMACSGPPAPSFPDDVPALATELCDPRRLCPRGFGLCIRCESVGDPRWGWSTAAGSASGLRLSFPGALPDCGDWTFDERGNPLTYYVGGERSEGVRRRWTYDARGRVVRVELHEPQMCEGELSEEACGPPDGIPDAVVDIAWRELEDGGSLALGTPAADPTAWFERRYDALGRLVQMRDSGGSFQRFDYGEGPVPVRELEGHGDDVHHVRLTELDAAGRPVRTTALSRPEHRRPVREVVVRRSRYDRLGRLTSRQLAGQEERWSYRDAGRLVLVEHSDRGRRRASERHSGPDGLLALESVEGRQLRVLRGARGRVVRTELASGGQTRVSEFSCHSQALWDALAAAQPRARAREGEAFAAVLVALEHRYARPPSCGAHPEGDVPGEVAVEHRLGTSAQPEAAVVRVVEPGCPVATVFTFVALREGHGYAVHPVGSSTLGARQLGSRRSWRVAGSSRPRPGLIRFDTEWQGELRGRSTERERDGTRCYADWVFRHDMRDAVLCRTEGPSACRSVHLSSRKRRETTLRCRAVGDGAEVEPPPGATADHPLSQTIEDLEVAVTIDDGLLTVRATRGDPPHNRFGELPRAVPLDTFFEEASTRRAE